HAGVIKNRRLRAVWAHGSRYRRTYAGAKFELSLELAGARSFPRPPIAFQYAQCGGSVRQFVSRFSSPLSRPLLLMLSRTRFSIPPPGGTGHPAAGAMASSTTVHWIR